MSKITVYGSPTCMPCKMTVKTLTASGVEFDYVDVSSDEAGLVKVRELGYGGVPVVVTPEGHFQGYQPDKLAALVA